MSPGVELMLLGGLAATAVVLVAGGYSALADERALGRRIASLDRRAPNAATEAAAGWLKRLEPALIGAGKDREEVEQALALAGYRHEAAAAIFGIGRLAAPIAFGGGFLAIAALGGGVSSAQLFIAVSVASAAFLAPKRILSMSVARRRRRIAAELPFTLDVLIMMLESGVSLDACFRAFAQADGRAAPHVQEAVIALVRDIERGVAYETALSRWGERLGVSGARELASVIQQSLAHGASAGRMLREFSREFAEKRVANARESIGRTSAKMTVAMLVFIMPALMIVLAGPAVATLGASIRALTN